MYKLKCMAREICASFYWMLPHTIILKHFTQLPASPLDSWVWLPSWPQTGFSPQLRSFSQRLERDSFGTKWKYLKLFTIGFGFFFFSPFSPRAHTFGWHQHASCMLNALHRKENNGAEESSYKPSGTQMNSDSTRISWVIPRKYTS